MFNSTNSIDLQQHTIWLIFFCTLLFFPGCNQDQSSETEYFSINFEEELVIGSDPHTQDEYLLANPSEIRTDQEGNIYISDRQTRSVQVFNTDGNFLHSIGGPGGGPGEFGNILAIDINSQSELLTYDGMNRRVTRFSDTGDVLATYIPGNETVVAPAYFRQIDEDRYLFLRKLRDIESNGNDEEHHLYSTLLHVFDGSFENRLESFGLIDSLMDANTQFVRHYTSGLNTGRFWSAGNSDVWFVPGIYDGRLFRFQQSPNGWKLADTLHGYVIPQEPVDVDSNADGTIAITVYAPRDETFSGKINSESLGVFTLNDGRLIHFSSQLDDDTRQTIVEVFNPNGKLDKVGRLDELTFRGSERGALISSMWKGNNDRFYFIDRSDVPIVRIGKIKGI